MFTLAAAAIFPTACLLSSTVLESGADGFVDAQANLALFSTQPRQYNLQMERGWMDLRRSRTGRARRRKRRC